MKGVLPALKQDCAFFILESLLAVAYAGLYASAICVNAQLSCSRFKWLLAPADAELCAFSHLHPHAAWTLSFLLCPALCVISAICIHMLHETGWTLALLLQTLSYACKPLPLLPDPSLMLADPCPMLAGPSAAASAEQSALNHLQSTRCLNLPAVADAWQRFLSHLHQDSKPAAPHSVAQPVECGEYYDAIWATVLRPLGFPDGYSQL
eukprot:scaffold11861_cov19-Tisochrysis_lutea.AAC.1